jgi:hypothetical protein
MNPPVIALMIPVIALMIPIVAILTRHQRDMALLVHGNQLPQDGRVEDLQRQVNELRQLAAQQAYMLDDLRKQLPSTSERDVQRISQGGF